MDDYNIATDSYALTVAAVILALGTEPIANQAYTVDLDVAFTLPVATGGTGTLSYSLTPRADIPAGLTFIAMHRVLTGTPTTARAAVTLTYTVTDSAPSPVTASRSVLVMVAKGTQAAFGFTDTIVTKFIGDPAFTESATGGSGNGAITYTSSTPAVASVNPTSGEVTIGMVGTTTITANKAADDDYNIATDSYALTVAAVILALGTEPIANQAYTVDLDVAFTLPVATGGTGTLSYSLTPRADIPAGLTFIAMHRVLTGTPTTARAAVTLTYTVTDSAPSPVTASRSVLVMVAKGTQAAFGFTDTIVTKFIGDPAFTESATGGSGNGAITYTSSTPAVASVNPTSGEVTIGMVGTTTITANKAADDDYNIATDSYELIVTVATLTFGLASIDEQVYSVGTVVNFTLPQATAAPAR